MKSSQIVSGITRVIDTFGLVNYGEELSIEFSDAINAVNARLDNVVCSLDSNQISEAVRILEESPRLLDEIAILDFNRLSEWQNLCKKNNWRIPLDINKNSLERILLFYESKDIVEPFLKMYRKAMLTNNLHQIVSSLRRLQQIDNSNDWKQNLIQSEKQLQNEYLKKFISAQKNNDTLLLERISQEYLENDWLEPHVIPGIEVIFNYLEEEKTKIQKKEAYENVSILRNNLEDFWNFEIVQSVIKSIDVLVQQGWMPSPEETDIIESCRNRYEKEIEEKLKEQQWQNLNSELFAAIQREDVNKIRSVLSSPLFLDKEPDIDLIRQAKLVILHKEEEKKRKTRQVVVCAIMIVFAILGLSSWWLSIKLFNNRCEMEAQKLAQLQEGQHVIERMEKALLNLKAENLKIYSDPRVNIYNDKLNILKEETLVRTNKIISILEELTQLENSGWKIDNEEIVTNNIYKIEKLLTLDDNLYKGMLLEIENSWLNFKESNRLNNIKEGTIEYNNLVEKIENIIKEIKEQPLTKDRRKKLQELEQSILDWKNKYSMANPLLEAKINDYEQQLTKEATTQKNLEEIIKKLNSSNSANEYLKQRQLIIEHYSMYPFVSDILQSYPIGLDNIDSIISKTTIEQQRFYELIKLGIEEEKFKTFVLDNVLSFKEFPDYDYLYGIFFIGGNKKCYSVSKGKPQFKEELYNSMYLIEGELIDYGKNIIVQQLRVPSKPYYKMLLPTEEIVSLVDYASNPKINQYSLKQRLLQLISNHINAAGEEMFHYEEVDRNESVNGLYVNRFPAISRIQLVSLYLRWLREDLKQLPNSNLYINELEKIEELAQPISIDGISEDLSWTCFNIKRVRERNSECAKLLENLYKNKFIDKLYDWDKACSQLRIIYHWNIEYAGSIKYDPYNVNNINSIICDTNKEIDGPLYVLRNQKGRIILKNVFIPSKNGLKNKWVFAPGMSNEIIIDASAKINEIFREIPKCYSKKFMDKIPLFDFSEK